LQIELDRLDNTLDEMIQSNPPLSLLKGEGTGVRVDTTE
jgi:hypothetical protein